MNKNMVATELVKIAKLLIAGFGDVDISGISVEQVKNSILNRYEEDGKDIYDAFKKLYSKFLKSGNSKLKVGREEYVLTMTKDMSMLTFSMFKDGVNLQYWIADIKPEQEAIDAYKRIYKIAKMLINNDTNGYKLVKTGRTWSIVDENGKIIEGGFFNKDKAEDALWAYQQNAEM